MRDLFFLSAHSVPGTHPEHTGLWESCLEPLESVEKERRLRGQMVNQSGPKDVCKSQRAPEDVKSESMRGCECVEGV